MAQLTKVELVKIVEEQKLEIARANQEKKRLADAVEGKDKELSKKNIEIDELRKRKNELQDENQQLKNTISTNEFQVESYKTRVAELEQIEARRVEELNEMIFIHGALVKTFQGALESASLLQDKTVAKIMKE